MQNDNLGSDLGTRLKNFLILLTEKFLGSFRFAAIVIAALFFLILGALLLVFR